MKNLEISKSWEQTAEVFTLNLDDYATTVTDLSVANILKSGNY